MITCYPSYRCCNCRNRTLSTAIAATATELVITIPANTYYNHNKLCLVLAQAIPEITGLPLPVVIQIGTDTTTYPLRDGCGNNIYSDQLRSRRIYQLIVNTESQTFVFRGRRRCLPCTRFVSTTTLPPAAAPATA